jgi:hypothetical protein
VQENILEMGAMAADVGESTVNVTVYSTATTMHHISTTTGAAGLHGGGFNIVCKGKYCSDIF